MNYRVTNSCLIYDLRKYYFTNRIVNIWNSLPNSVVTANTTNKFKNRLDKFWGTRIFYMILTLNCKEPKTEVECDVR